MSEVLHNIDQKPRNYFAALDGFRGLLAVFVAVYHTIWLSHPQSWAFFNNGPVIIDLFFAFSGFLMWRLYSETLETPADAKLFLTKRFARLYPLHLFMLAVFVIFAIARLFAHKIGIAELTEGEVLPFEPGAQEGWFALLQHLTLTHSLGLSDSLTFNPPSWTIGAEFCTYLVFVAVMLWCKPKRLFDFVLIGSGIVAIYAVLSSINVDMDITYDGGFWRCLAGFFTGLLAAASFKRFGPRLEALSTNAFHALEIAILMGSIAFVVFAGGKLQFFVAPVIFLFVLIFAFDRGVVSRFMSHRIFRYLAKISYSVYMIHVIIAIAFAILIERLTGSLPQGWAGDAWLALYLCVVIFCSHLTQRFVEVPGGRFLRNWRSPQKRVAKTGSSV